MKYLTFDDIVYAIQKFGGATTYWQEVTARVSKILGEESICRVSSRGGLLDRLSMPKVSTKVFHSSHFRIGRGSGVKNVTTIHDLIYEKGLAGGRGRILNMYERRKSIEGADAIICISASTKKDMIEYYGEVAANKPVYVIHHGFNGWNEQSFFEAKLGDLSVETEYFLYVGGRGGYKNFGTLLKAFKQGGFHKNGIRLLCTGSGFSESEIRDLKGLGIFESVKCIGKVSLKELSRVYRNAIALVYPSAYEGFGLPPLEAMGSGCPVIASNTSSLPEVVGGAGILINPFDVDEMVSAMNQMLMSDVRLQYVAAGLEWCKSFTWDESAKKHVDVYRSLANLD